MNERTSRDRSRPDRRSVTAADVARAAGVSRSAVSRAFTEGASVAPETRADIRQVAARLGYVPNLLARGLLTGSSSLVAVVVNTVSDLWDTFFFDKLFQALQAIGKQPLIVHTHAVPDLRQVLREGASYQVGGVLVFADNVTAAMAKSVFRTSAIVMMNRHDRPDDRVDSVRLDERSDLTRIVDALVRIGLKRVSYVSGRRTATFEDERLLAVQHALARHGLAPFGPATGGAFTYEAGAQAADTLLKAGGPQPGVILCACDAMAFGVIDVARSKGLRIPADLSVVGFDDIPLSAWPAYKLTTVHQNVDGLVAAAVQLLESRLTNSHGSARIHVLETSIVLRATTPAALAVELESRQETLR